MTAGRCLEAEAILGKALAAQAAVAAPVTGTDDTGVVSVVAAADDTIVEFYPEPGWRQSNGIAGLGTADRLLGQALRTRA
jgi:hypothetical protein